MNRKRMTFWLLLFLLLSTIASAQQATKTDIQALETKVSNLEITVKEMDKRITAQIQAVHVRIDIDGDRSPRSSEHVVALPLSQGIDDR